jgi:NNP family nitrate/nitrite transporter-like MFS transporter
VLIVSTLAFTVCFMVWMMFGVIGIPIKKTLGLNATEFGLLTATPVLTGSLIRVPLGIWTDKYGGRIVMTLLMAATVPAIWLMSYATAYWHFLVIGLFVGLAGGSFSVGTPYVARWFPKNRQGMAMGSTAPATPARRSTSSSRRRCWWPSAGPWCRRSMPPSCWAR